MSTDTRAQAAKYYDLSPDTPADVPFYQGLMPSPEARVLELGCGTGRVLAPLAAGCGSIYGLDLSAAMVAVCRKKLEAAGIAPPKAQVAVQDITNFTLNQRFDLIIAPYRVLQNWRGRRQSAAYSDASGAHLTPGGSCILNVFRPNGDTETLRREWCTEQEKLCWEVAVEGGHVTCHDRRPLMDPAKMILYPELIYRRYQGEVLVEGSDA